MKIVFLCGSLEPGHDGVGDYTRRIAGELIQQGHYSAAVALFERCLPDELSEIQYSDNIDIPVLRIPSFWPVKRRVKRAKAWIDEHEPDWISLQFVIFSFQPKGFPFFLHRHLKEIVDGRNLHIMFHELWIGISSREIIKSFLTHSLQKLIIKQVLETLQPAIIHTNLPTYQLELERLGWQVYGLPLFSNIEVESKNNTKLNNNIFRIGFFSQAEVSEAIAEFLVMFGKQAAMADLEVEVLLIGGAEVRLKSFGEQVENICGYRSRVSYTGYLTPQKLSKALQSCTIGLTSVPRHGLGKSGSVAAFIAHGVPVAAPNVHTGYNPEVIGFFSKNISASILLEPNFDKLQETKKKMLSVRNEIMVSAVVEKFLVDLRQ